MGHDSEHPHNPALDFMHKQMDVTSGLGLLHTVADAVKHGGHHLSHLGHGPPGVMEGIGGFMAPLTIFNGGFEMASGFDRIRHGESEEGTLDMLSGAGEVVEGGANLAALLGIGGAALGPVMGAGLGGLKLGRWGDKEAKRLGWMGKDEKGENRSASDWAADGGVDDYAKTKHDSYQLLQKFLPQRVADIGSEVAGHGMGIKSTLEHSVAGAGAAVGAAAYGGAERGWNALKGLFGGGEGH